jgi:hypothetical protein
MLHAGLDLSRRRLDRCRLDVGAPEPVGFGAVSPDADGLRGLARLIGLRHGARPVAAAIESMNGARFVHDTLERCGWDVQVADAARVRGRARRPGEFREGTIWSVFQPESSSRRGSAPAPRPTSALYEGGLKVKVGCGVLVRGRGFAGGCERCSSL